VVKRPARSAGQTLPVHRPNRTCSNDKYDYDDADLLLKKIAGQLQVGARDFFPDGAVPIRAHGDEFFIVGGMDSGLTSENQIAEALDRIRANIAAIRLLCKGKAGSKPESKPEPMSCTVSVGWLISTDLWDAGLTPRMIRGKLEVAVAEAKQTRNTTVRFSAQMTTAPTVDGRADCSACGAKFSVTIKEASLRKGDLHCPNCGTSVARPPSLVCAPSAQETSAPAN
jgi:GGDEF domain-containing protein/predicted RNA-binding Zn-ribbon protein involved in translation (DUF1610 family)